VEGILFLGVISSMIAFTIQIVAQKKIPAHIAGLIFLMESPFAAVFGYFYFHEVLSVMNIVGAAMIMLAVLLVPILGKEVSATL
jgi:drug/metabolite transporter (DMT)-like permease